jgi:hypothetical protein
MTEARLDELAKPSDAADQALELEAFSTIVRTLQALSPTAQKRVTASILTFLGISMSGGNSVAIASPLLQIARDRSQAEPRFSDDRAPSAKEFLREKRPSTDVERVACLAYYLTHYMGIAQFKTLDVSKLNTEAAQLKFSNPTVAVDNATRAGLLVPATKGAKQISDLGELYVQALPDKEAARSAISHARRRRKKRRTKTVGTDDETSSSGE